MANKPITASISLRFWVKPMVDAAQAFAICFMLNGEQREDLANGLIEFIVKHGVKAKVG